MQDNENEVQAPDRAKEKRVDVAQNEQPVEQPTETVEQTTVTTETTTTEPVQGESAQ